MMIKCSIFRKAVSNRQNNKNEPKTNKGNLDSISVRFTNQQLAAFIK